MRWSVSIAAAFIVLTIAPAIAQPSKESNTLPSMRTVEEYLPACKGLPAETPFNRGYCQGVLTALLDFISMQLLRPDEWKICVPMGTTNEQVLTAIDRYLDLRADEIHNDFLEVALKAIGRAWPCPLRQLPK